MLLYGIAMVFSIIFLIELILLFISSQMLTQSFSAFLLRKTRNQEFTINILSTIFLPGVILHEMAHWFVANILFVRTGDIEFLPKLEGNTVKLGSVAIAQTDPFRRFLIGIAPILVGLSILFVLFYYLTNVPFGLNWQTAILLYASFEIGNTMFSSKKDMEGAFGLVIACIVVGIILYFFGFRISSSWFQFFLSDPFITFFQKGVMILAVPLVINIASIGLMRVLQR